MSVIESIAVEPQVDLPELLTYFHEFREAECCARCVPCREAANQICIVLTRTILGEGRDEDELVLQELGHLMSVTSKCRLGREAGDNLVAALGHQPVSRSAPARHADAVTLAAAG